MSTSQGTLSLLAQEFEKVIAPIHEKLEEDQLLALLEQLGLRLDAVLGPSNAVQNAVGSLLTKVSNLVSQGLELADAISAEDNDRILNLARDMAGLLKGIIADLDALATAIDNAATPSGSISASDIQQFTNQLAVKLVEYTLLRYLEDQYPLLQSIMELPGIVERLPQRIGSTDPDKPPYTQRSLHLDRLGDLFSDPQGLFQSLYGWGGNSLEVDLLFQRLAALLGQLNVPVHVLPPEGTITTKRLQIGDLLITPDLSASPDHLTLTINRAISSLATIEVPLGLSNWSVESTVSGELSSGATLVIAPPFNLRVTPTTAGNFTFSISLVGRKPGDQAYILLGEAGGSRLQVDEIRFTTGANLVYDSVSGEAQGAVFVEADLEAGNIAIDLSNADGFLGQLLGSIDLDFDFDLTIGVNSESGFYFVGSSALEIALPLHIDLSVVKIQGLNLRLRPDSSGLPIDLGANLNFNLGALKASVENIGLTSTFGFPSNKKDGNLGPLDFSLGFKPPNGIGLAVDAGPIKGGGYLFFDFDREEYAGALELVFSEWIALKAIGLITTRMPDGSKGFSLLIIITVEFGSGIQLGFGFTLLGVGGILGLNRSVNIDPLALSVRTGAIESVMFPQNVIENAPRIISDLRQFFPTAEGIFLVGPMAKIGFGTPTLISLSMGLILEFPQVNITILGVLKVVLPTEEADILRLQVNFVGRIEPSNSLLWFYAELYDSRILFLTLEGGLGLLVNWGDQANVVVSVGGFHPRYTPPPLPFPAPPRIAVNILNTSVARIRIEGYFAVTSNSVQFGAKAEMYFGFSAISVEGHLSFDALFQFDPFFFSFQFSVKFSVKVFGFGIWGIDISALLEGPTPWYIKGKASFKVTFLGPRIRVNLERTWGENRDTELPPIEVLPLLTRELTALPNWEGVVPNGSQLLVSLRQLGDAEESEALVLHPVGKLRVRQRKLPLDLRMDKFGTQRPSDYRQFSLSASISGASLAVRDVEDQFASGEFLDLENTKKLSSPGFEYQNSGIEIAIEDEQLRSSQAVKRENRYETIIIDNNFKTHRVRFYRFFETVFADLGGLFRYFLRGSAVKQSPLSLAQQQRVQPFAEKIEVQPHQYAVVSVADLQPHNGTAMHFSSQAKARQYLDQQLETDPKLVGNLQVIPNTELTPVA